MNISVKDRNEISFCGISCGKCIKGKGEAKEKAEQILKDMEESELDRWQQHEPKQEPFNYDDLKKGLRWLASMDCNGCHEGDGYPECAIRACAEKKRVDNCGECSEMPCNVIRKAKEEMGVDVERNFNREP